MRLFHGSYIEVKYPDLQHSRRNVDFGAGFYVTPIYEQAVKWSQKFLRYDKQAVVTTYDFDDSSIPLLSVREFNKYSQEWLDFIVDCRRGNDTNAYDLIIGGVANDKVFNTIELFFDGLIDKGEAIKRLKYEKPNLQYCFKNQETIDRYLKFERSEIV